MLRREPRPPSTSRPTAHGGRVLWPLGHMGRSTSMGSLYLITVAMLTTTAGVLCTGMYCVCIGHGSITGSSNWRPCSWVNWGSHLNDQSKVDAGLHAELWHSSFASASLYRYAIIVSLLRYCSHNQSIIKSINQYKSDYAIPLSALHNKI